MISTVGFVKSYVTESIINGSDLFPARSVPSTNIEYIEPSIKFGPDNIGAYSLSPKFKSHFKNLDKCGDSGSSLPPICVQVIKPSERSSLNQ